MSLNNNFPDGAVLYSQEMVFGTSFTITSASAMDISTWDYWIIN